MDIETTKPHYEKLESYIKSRAKAENPSFWHGTFSIDKAMSYAIDGKASSEEVKEQLCNEAASDLLKLAKDAQDAKSTSALHEIRDYLNSDDCPVEVISHLMIGQHIYEHLTPATLKELEL
ncbi:hypothetical protein QX249_11955 [Vibrio parahaemolyticus]|uniref:Uncharacterized protein n=1 Tax=Vibrio parahaemolyticus TaxID=670 RepID=A0AAW8PZY9_VIBPH|nr:hypothetical protein [Vibrio parahaemolyticus]EGR2227326.1 hypothetical protein [Vibrio parahaemolyticus]MDS1821375.1 hypothetical protein [Vibrio parahaemolyticus]